MIRVSEVEALLDAVDRNKVSTAALYDVKSKLIGHEGSYIVVLNQEEIATIAGFIQPTSSDIEVDAICGPFDTLREKFPERAFWETVEELGESFYWNDEEED